MKLLLGSAVCTSGAVCGRCRDQEGGRALREQLGRFYQLPEGGVDFVCPFFAWGFAGEETARGGVGTELAKLLAWWGIEAEEGCACKARARLMDRAGLAWCETNKQTIIDWLEEEARRRGQMFHRTLAFGVVTLAIARARQAGG